MNNKEYEEFKNNYLQHPITFLTEENLDKLETHCRKAIRYERGVEHKVVLELLERHKEHLSEREQDKKRIKELESKNRIYVLNGNNVKLELYIKENYIPKQKVKGLLTEIQKEYEKLDKASDEFLSNEKKTVEDYILEKERLATMQTLAYCRDNLEELLEEK